MPLRDHLKNHLEQRLERWLGLGVALTPRAVQVGQRAPGAEIRPLRSTPGARLRVCTDGSGPAHRALAACLLAGVDVEIIEVIQAKDSVTPPSVTLDGAPLSGDDLLRYLRAAQRRTR